MTRKTREPQCQDTLNIAERQGLTRFGLMSNQVWHDGPKRIVFLLSRYRIVAKMLAGIDVPPVWNPICTFVSPAKEAMCMRKSRCSEERAIGRLKQVEAGRPVAELCRQIGITDTTFCKWRNWFAGLEVSEAGVCGHLSCFQ